MTTQLTSLSDLPEGKIGIIREINTESATAQRLLDLGFVPDTPIKAIKRAPMGDPTTFEIRGYQLGLRRSESEAIKVELANE